MAYTVDYGYASTIYWPNWIYNASTTVSNNTIVYADTTTLWTNWITVGSTNSVTVNYWPDWVQQVPLGNRLAVAHALPREDEATVQRRLVTQQDRQRQMHEERQRYLEEQAEAGRKAEALLREFLSPEQLADHEKKTGFLVTSKSGRIYRILPGKHGNVLELHPDTRKPVAKWCAAPTDGVPDQDAMLAQKLFLETDEDYFRKIANRTGLAHVA